MIFSTSLHGALSRSFARKIAYLGWWTEYLSQHEHGWVPLQYGCQFDGLLSVNIKKSEVARVSVEKSVGDAASQESCDDI